MPRPFVRTSCSSQVLDHRTRFASRSMSKTLWRSSASSGVRRSIRSVATLPCCKWRATKLLRGLNLPLPLPWAKTTTPSACVGRPKAPSRERASRVSLIAVSFSAVHPVGRNSGASPLIKVGGRSWENRQYYRGCDHSKLTCIPRGRKTGSTTPLRVRAKQLRAAATVSLSQVSFQFRTTQRLSKSDAVA